MDSPQAAPRRRVLSVRARLMAVITAVAVVGLAGVGGAVYVVERERILASVEDLLLDNLGSAQQFVQNVVADQPGATARDALRVVVERISPDDNMGVLGIVNGAAELKPGVPLDLDLEDNAGFVEHVVREADQRNAMLGRYVDGDSAWQYLATPIVLAGDTGDDEVLFVMAYDLNAELAEINEPARAYLVASGIMIVLIVAAGALAAGRLLRPLRQMRETAERVSGQSLTERLPIEGRDDVSELARTMNDMLDRLDQALDSQRQLLSDVRHELRTPITIVRGHLELMDPADPADVRETQELAIDELDRMSTLVQDLSEAASLHGASPVRVEPTDVPDLLSQIVRKARAIEGATVTEGPVVSAVVPLDPGRVTQAVLQLTQNGVTHGGGRLVIGSRIVDGALEIWVRDFGPGVHVEARERVFERFHREDATGRGSGLGLNIVQVIARAHGGSARVIDPYDGPGAVFVLSFPLPHGAPDERDAAGVPADADIPLRPPLPAAADRGADGGPRSDPSADPGADPSGSDPSPDSPTAKETPWPRS